MYPWPPALEASTLPLDYRGVTVIDDDDDDNNEDNEDDDKTWWTTWYTVIYHMAEVYNDRTHDTLTNAHMACMLLRVHIEQYNITNCSNLPEKYTYY